MPLPRSLFHFFTIFTCCSVDECTIQKSGGAKCENKNRIQAWKWVQTERKAHDFYEIIKNSLKLMWQRMRNISWESSVSQSQSAADERESDLSIDGAGIYLFSHYDIIYYSTFRSIIFQCAPKRSFGLVSMLIFPFTLSLPFLFLASSFGWFMYYDFIFFPSSLLPVCNTSCNLFFVHFSLSFTDFLSPSMKGSSSSFQTRPCVKLIRSFDSNMSALYSLRSLSTWKMWYFYNALE